MRGYICFIFKKLTAQVDYKKHYTSAIGTNRDKECAAGSTEQTGQL